MEFLPFQQGGPPSPGNAFPRIGAFSAQKLLNLIKQIKYMVRIAR